MNISSDLIRGKRLLALDYGDARIGVAVCDELHIVVSTRPVINNDATMWDVLLRRLADDRIDVVIVGVPRKLDDTSSPIIERILSFIDELKQRTDHPVYDVDEAFSTQRARELYDLQRHFKKAPQRQRHQRSGRRRHHPPGRH